MTMHSCDLDYELPSDLIATKPAEPRDAARLMIVHRRTGRVEHRFVRELPEAANLGPRDVIVFNQTRVLPAHFDAVRSATNGHMIGLYLNSSDEPDQTWGVGSDVPTGSETPASASANADVLWNVMLESRGKLRAGEHVQLNDQSHLELLAPLGGGQWQVRLVSPLGTFDLLDRIGTTPLPPYIRQQRRVQRRPQVHPADVHWYNTVFAREPGSVAAPTAALHFTPELLERIDACGVTRAALTLHIGLGTFAPVRAERLEDHTMHEEWMRVPAKTIAALRRAREQGGRIIPVGTTCVRAMESLPEPMPAKGDFVSRTQLFIHPPDPGESPFAFRFTDALLTNFHLPRSTLLALVATLPGVGLTKLKHWYRIAIEKRYRFYSYGDAALLL